MREVPLWLDEAMLALNVMHLSPVELLGPLEFHQAAPWIFLLAADGVSTLLGPTEASLRMVPAVASVAALCLFARFLWERFGLGSVTLVAAVCLAFLPTVILEAGNFKPYSLDVATTSCLLLLWHRYGIEAPTVTAGILVPWISLPSVFVLAGIGLAHFREGLREVAIVGTLWLVSIVGYWSISLRHVVSDEYLSAFWAPGFAPGLPDLFVWLPYALVDFFRQPAWFVLPAAAAALALIGMLRLARDDPDLSMLIAGTVLGVLVASALQIYPALERTLFFLVPLGIVALAAGASRAFELSGLRRALALGCVGALVLGNVVPTLYGSLFMREERLQRSERDYDTMIQRLNQKRPGHVYIHDLTVPGFLYYAERLGFAVPYDSVSPETSPRVHEDGAWIVAGIRWPDESPEERSSFERWVRQQPTCETIRVRGLTAYQVCGGRGNGGTSIDSVLRR